jgi:hypothetical protein
VSAVVNPFTGKIDFTGTPPDLSGYALLDGTNQPFTGNVTISKANPKIIATDTGLASSIWLERDTTLDGGRLVSQNRLYTLPNALTLAGATYGSGLSYTSTGALSVSFWWKTSNAGDSYFIGNSTASSDFRWGSGVLSFQDETAGLARYWSATGFNNDTWRHIVLTISSDRATVKAYVNGALATQTQAGTVGGNFIINRIFATNGNTTGSFDDFRILTTELSLAQVQAIYNARQETTDMTNMYAYYKLNETSGTSVSDSSGNARTVTLVGGTPVWATGTVASTPASVSDIPVLRMSNNSTGNSYGDLTLGYYSASNGTSNIYDGLSHTWRALGTSKMTLTSSGVNISAYTGNLITDTSNLALTISGTTTTRSLTLLSASDGGYISGKGSASDALFLGTGTGASKIVTINSSGLSTTGRVYTANGTALLPAVVASADTNTGVYWSGADDLLFSTAGVARMSFNNIGTAGFIPNGTSTLNISSTGVGIGGLYSGYAGQFNVQNTSSATTKVTSVFKLIAAQTADLIQLQDSAGSVIARYDASGNYAQGTVTSSGILSRFFKNSTQLTVTQYDVYADGTHTLNADNAISFRGIYSGISLNTAGFNQTNSFASSGGLAGFYSLPQVLSTPATGTVTGVNGYFASVRNTGAGAVTDMASYHASTTINSGGGSILRAYGFYSGNQTGGTSNYGFYGASTAATNSWNIYMAGSAQNYLAGNLGVGTPTISAKAHVLATTEQLRLGYDASNYLSTTVSSAGAVTFDAVGASSAFTFSDNVTISGSISANEMNASMILQTQVFG